MSASEALESAFAVFFKNPDLTLLSAEVRVHAAACVSTDFIYDGSCLSCVHKKGSKL